MQANGADARGRSARWRPFRKAALLGIASLAAWLLTRLAQSHPEAVERIYSRGIYPLWGQALSTVTGLLPVSLSEVLLFALPALLALGVVQAARRRIAWRRLVAGWLCVPLCGYLVFSLGWALNYSRKPYAEIAGLPVQAVEVNTLERLVVRLADQANDLRAELGGGEEPFALSVDRRTVLREHVNEAYASAAQAYPWLGGHYGAPKFALLSTPLAYLQISGIFSPFTFEAHVNAHESDALLAATAAHEGAHLRGFAREDEANFIAYAVCMESPRAYVRYSGTLLALIYAGNALGEADPAAYAAVWATYSPAVVADLRAYNAAWEPYDGEAAEVHEQLNDAYLKANGQTEGVRSYGRMVDLLIAQMLQEEREEAQ